MAASKARDDAGYASITMKSPVGVLTLIADAKHLVAVQWKNDAPPPLPRARRQPDHPVLLEAQQQLTRYFEERLWEPLGAERPAAWSLDSAEKGVEKFSSGLSATARDYARLGVLFQHGGRVRDRPVISEQWVEDSLAPDDVAGIVHTTDGAVRRGRYEWFWTLDGRSYFAKGYNGQYVFVDRDRDVVVVRFGEGYGEVDWTVLFKQIAESLAP